VKILKYYFSSLEEFDNVRYVTDTTCLMQSWNAQEAMSEQLLKVTSLSQTQAVPPINCFIFYNLLKANPCAHQSLL